MGLQENMSLYLSAKKKHLGVSTEEFSAELCIARSTLQEYLNGTGNPSLTTVEHIADKLGAHPITMLAGSFTPDQLNIIHLMFDILSCVSALDPDKQRRFSELLLQILDLWEDKE